MWIFFYIDRGQCHFDDRDTTISSLWQYVNMTPTIDPSHIDNQNVYYNCCTWLRGYAKQNDEWLREEKEIDPYFI